MNAVSRIRRTLPWISTFLAIALVAAGWLALHLHREHQACKRRGAALEARLEKIRAEGRRLIVPGTSKDTIVQFLNGNGLRVSFESDGIPRIVGSATALGCAEIFGCGDEVLIEVAVDVDGGGRATASPTVDSRYDDCL
jgi:hypothetical protein